MCCPFCLWSWAWPRDDFCLVEMFFRIFRMEFHIFTSSSTLPWYRPQTRFPPHNCTGFSVRFWALCVSPKPLQSIFPSWKSCSWLQLSPRAAGCGSAPQQELPFWDFSAHRSCTSLQHSPLTLISGILLLCEKIAFNCHSSFVWILLLNEQLSCSKLLLKSRQSRENADAEVWGQWSWKCSSPSVWLNGTVPLFI